MPIVILVLAVGTPSLFAPTSLKVACTSGASLNKYCDLSRPCADSAGRSTWLMRSVSVPSAAPPTVTTACATATVPMDCSTPSYAPFSSLWKVDSTKPCPLWLLATADTMFFGVEFHGCVGLQTRRDDDVRSPKISTSPSSQGTADVYARFNGAKHSLPVLGTSGLAPHMSHIAGHNARVISTSFGMKSLGRYEMAVKSAAVP